MLRKASGEVAVDPCCLFLDHPRTHHQLLADDIGVLGRLAERLEEEFRLLHVCPNSKDETTRRVAEALREAEKAR
jgi:hypothetical protein